MKRQIIYKCRFCKKENIGKLYCNNEHKNRFYFNLRNIKPGINNKTPEEFINEELNKPINELFLKVERVNILPNKRGRISKYRELFIILDKDIKPGEIRRLPSEYDYNRGAYFRSICDKLGLKLYIFSRTVDGNRYLYFTKEL